MQPVTHTYRTGSLFAAALMLGLSSQSGAQNAPMRAAVPIPEVSRFDVADSAAIRALLAAARNPAMHFDLLTDVAGDLRRLYDSSAFRPHWIDISTASDSTKYKPSQAAVQLVAAINLVNRRGLSADDYDVMALPTLMLSLNSPAARAQYDVAFSANALRLVRSLHDGRIKASDAHAELRIPRPRYDAANVVRVMSDSANVEQRLDAEEPPFIHYQLLKTALAKYRTLRADTSIMSLPPLVNGKVIKAGGQYAGIGKIA